MRLEQDEAIEYLSQRTYNNTEDRLQKNRQRRNQVVDLYGIEYTRQGDANNPATFYISISPDMVYLERFEFKLIVSPFLTSGASSVSTATVNITGNTEETELGIANNDVNPKKHKHALNLNNVGSHTHTVTGSTSGQSVTANTFTMSIDGIDVTAYLKAQYTSYSNDWPNGEGIFPSNGSTIEVEDNYDILAVASVLTAEGREDDAKKLTTPGYKKIVISGNGAFQVALVNYLKYSHLNR